MANQHTTLISLFDDIADAIRAGHTSLTAEIPADYFPDVIRGLWAGTKKSLNDCSWEYIRWASDAGIADLLWSVGDRKAVTLSGTWGYTKFSETYYCYILGFNHNAAKEGSNRIHFEFGFDALSGGNHIAFAENIYGKIANNTTTTYMRMNTSKTNTGGWKESTARTGTLNGASNSFKTILPSDLQNVLKAVTKYTDNVGGGLGNTAESVSATTDTIFLLSGYEFIGGSSTTQLNSAEFSNQVQYDYYKNGNSKLRGNHTSASTKIYVWTRSPHALSSTNFTLLHNSTDGGIANHTASISYGMSPAFCV